MARYARYGRCRRRRRRSHTSMIRGPRCCSRLPGHRSIRCSEFTAV